MIQANLTKQHDPEWALFLPAVSSFYIAGIGKQREGETYFPASRIPVSFNGDVEKLNFLNSKEGLYTYKWGLYSAGHANLDINVDDHDESVIRKREAGTFMLGDSGGFQILKGQWPADWKNPSCPKALAKRKAVLTWMETYMDYGMCLDIPSQSITTYGMKYPEKHKLAGQSLHGIATIEDAIAATHINNEYFIQHRIGECKFLNVMQGRTQDQSHKWYAEMKKYCDPNIYPDKHFNGWAFGGQNKIDLELMLIRLVHIIHDGLLEEGKHDLLHCLGTSILEYAVMFTDIQRAIRQYHNPKFQITFDCASPFFAAAKGLAYFNINIEHDKKWSYSMEKTAESKDYASDTRKYSTAVVADGIHDVFMDSPVTDLLMMKDLCYRGHGFIGQHGKETKTSWDTLSYTLLQSHNVYQHIWAVQEANRKYATGVIPSMVMHEKFDRVRFGDIVDQIFKLKDRDKSIALIDEYSWFWTQMKSGSQGISGKKLVNSITKFEELFVIGDAPATDDDFDEEMTDSDDEMQKVIDA